MEIDSFGGTSEIDPNDLFYKVYIKDFYIYHKKEDIYENGFSLNDFLPSDILESRQSMQSCQDIIILKALRKDRHDKTICMDIVSGKKLTFIFDKDKFVCTSLPIYLIPSGNVFYIAREESIGKFLKQLDDTNKYSSYVDALNKLIDYAREYKSGLNFVTKKLKK